MPSLSPSAQPASMLIRERLAHYVFLMRLDKPIGILLLFWPTLWALWLASNGRPDNKILVIFVFGVILMRSAGCVINDFADRHFDAHVKRTRARPLAQGSIPVSEAIFLLSLLGAVAFWLVLQCNLATIIFAFFGAALTFIYPFLKRCTHLPQVGLGMAFSWGVPMAFVAETGTINVEGWVVFLTAAIWPVIYDTFYAMTDKEDDLKIGIKSTAILFDMMDKLIIGLLQGLFLVMLVVTGLMFELNAVFYVCIAIVGLLFSYQQWLIKDRSPEKCFKAFFNNHWVGLIIFMGILLSYLQ